ncbi:MAG: hypothetical protein IT181_22830, partial [Acidobacteria bacterium]|nr:hypothetical protein [Acidobacteriota bacterium]
PYRLRARVALRRSRALVRSAFTPAKVKVAVRRGAGTVTVSGGIFCALREPLGWPACGYFAAAVATHLALQGVRADVRIAACQATGEGACTLQVTFLRPGEEPLVAVSADEEAA